MSDAPVATWRSFFTTNMRSARYRPWMPAAGNHENEVGNGPQGYPCYETRFALPDNGSARFTGNWYAFTVGAIRVLSINNDDVCLQDGAFSAYRRDHVPGYTANGYDPYIRASSQGRARTANLPSLRVAMPSSATPTPALSMGASSWWPTAGPASSNRGRSPSARLTVLAGVSCCHFRAAAAPSCSSFDGAHGESPDEAAEKDVVEQGYRHRDDDRRRHE